jgi:Cd2+/Zn2+-exporting ATPase
MMGEHRGVVRAHTVDGAAGDGELCLHYDPEMVTLAQVERLARAAGARLSDRFGHEIVTLRAIDGEDAARRIETDLRSLKGVVGGEKKRPGNAGRRGGEDVGRNSEESSCGCEPHPAKA